MSETAQYDTYLHFRTPEWQQPHGRLRDRVATVCNELWLPGPNAETFTYDYSAACEEVALCFTPPIVFDTDPSLFISLKGPSRRGREGMDRGFGVIAHINAARFMVHSPQDAAFIASRGVTCEVSDYSDRIIFSDSVTYWQFEHFANISGLFEPAGRSERFGRRTLTLLDACLQAHEPPAGYPRHYSGRLP
ncbi:MAG TPA: hypothetical protein VLA88_06145 [Candidatus Saccharimonadales bacterium]|nr:hypothetical protein [Candidatus Saccharimonadales bacterium]